MIYFFHNSIRKYSYNLYNNNTQTQYCAWMMGLRSLFPKKEIRYRADRDIAVNMMVSSKGKKDRKCY